MTRDKIRELTELLSTLEQLEKLHSNLDDKKSKNYWIQLKTYERECNISLIGSGNFKNRLLNWLKNEIEVELPKEIGLEMD